MFNKYKKQSEQLSFELNNKNSEIDKLNQKLIECSNDLVNKEKEIQQLNYQLKSLDLSKRQIELNRLSSEISSKTNELNSIQSQIVDTDKKVYIQSCGLFELTENLQYYQNELKDIREKEKTLLYTNKYYECANTWAVNGNVLQGKNLANFLANTCITSFNLMCDAIFDKLTVANSEETKQRIMRIYNNFNIKLKVNDLTLSDEYLNLKLQELDYRYKIVIKKQQDKENEKYRKELLKEQSLADKELKKEEERLKNELLRLENKQLKGDNSEILDKSINDIKEKIGINEYRQTNSKVGYVYIVSNPSLGKDIYKIGISRRIDNMCEERLSELSGSNVPFAFKPNCLIWSDDCFKLETELHKEFNKYRVNKIKLHREFFKLPLIEIEKVLKEKYHLDIQINYDIIDDDFIASGWNIKENFISDRV